MKVYVDLESFSPYLKHPLILALGNFDGVHLGHQKILESVVERARTLDGVPAVLTFYEHPQRVLHGSREPALLTSPQHRLFLFQELGIEVCFLIHFTREFSKTSPEAFVHEWLVNRLRVREIHLGYNAHFGCRREGDGMLMRRLSQKLGFQFVETKPVQIDRSFISSSLIREKIHEGNLEEAEKFLGRSFRLFATVVRGKGRGKKLGFPTANLQPHSEILPPWGVYPVRVREHSFHLKGAGRHRGFRFEAEQEGQWHEGILNLGVRPTFGKAESEAIPEVFLFNFGGKLYGKTVEVIFYPRLREEKEFKNPEELAAAIKNDVRCAQDYFGKTRVVDR